MKNLFKENSLKIIVAAIVVFLSIYFFNITLNYGFYGIGLTFFFIGVLFIFIDIVKEEYQIKKLNIGIIGISILLIVILPIISSLSLFYSSEYYNLIQNKNKIKISEFNKDISPVDLSKIITVDQKLAKKLGNKILGQDIALGSIVEVGEFSIQTVNDELVWVAPLEHSGFFKWLNSKNGTPGYIIVNATNENDVRLILNKKIKYQPSAYFEENLRRHVYFNGYMSQGLTDYSFEIDNKGNPYWVITKFKKFVGFEGSDAIGTVIVNALTGEIKEYSIEETPKWVDRIQPKKFIVEQLDDWGKFKNGWLNSIFTKKEVLKTTKGISLVYGNDGSSYWYTGMTSTGSDGSTVGFVLVNTRTKETSFYKISGATEVRAMSSAEGLVQEKRYSATFPILYNILGVPTYVMTLKDNEGLVKNIALVNVKNYNIVGIGINVKDALRNYKSKLVSKGNNIKLSSSIKLKELTGKIKRINLDNKNGNSYFYFMLDNSDKIFILDSSLSEEIIVTNINDLVTIKYEDSKLKIISLSSFDNLEI